MRNIYLYTLILFLCSACVESEPPHDDNRFIKDEYGRTLILHGLNTSSNAKYGDYLPWISEADVEKEAKAWGFNVVRYLTSWEALEPDSGQFNYDHLDAIEERIEWYTSRKMYVLIDMHQDVYGPLVGGNGHPAWATETNGFTYVGGSDIWWLNNLDPATIAAYQNFWQYSNYTYLQDHYIEVWKKVVERFKDNPYVIGYDMMNEPFPGELALWLNGAFEKYQLQPFYKRLISAIRSIDNEKYIFFEAQSLGVNFGIPSQLPKLEDPRTGQEKLVFAPHCYPLFVDLNGTYDQGGKDNIAIWESSRESELNNFRCPIFIGEFGLSPEVNGFDEFLNDYNNMADRMQASWTYWSNDQGGWSPTDGFGNETPILNELIRTYPKAISGRLLNYSFDKSTLIFNLKFENYPSITMPTEIFIPNRFYENGWELEVTGTDNWTQEWNVEYQTLEFRSNDDTEISIKIKPKQ